MMDRITTEFNQIGENRSNWCLYSIGLVVVIQSVLMLVAVIILGNIAPEISTTLNDVKTMLPEMRRSLLELGHILPEVKSGMLVLTQLCHISEQCTVT